MMAEHSLQMIAAPSPVVIQVRHPQQSGFPNSECGMIVFTLFIAPARCMFDTSRHVRRNTPAYSLTLVNGTIIHAYDKHQRGFLSDPP